MTLNEVFYKFLHPILEGNEFIRKVGFGDLEEYGMRKDAEFPFAWVTTPTLRRVRQGFNYSLTLVFGDVVNHEESNIIEVQSDMIQVACDVANKIINDKDFPIEASEDFTLTPFVQRFHDLTAGVTMDITFLVGAPLGGCEDC